MDQRSYSGREEEGSENEGSESRSDVEASAICRVFRGKMNTKVAAMCPEPAWKQLIQMLSDFRKLAEHTLPNATRSICTMSSVDVNHNSRLSYMTSALHLYQPPD